jgi:hypothetical protein
MIKTFKTILTTDKVVNYDDIDFTTKIHNATIVWEATFNFKENGLVEPPTYELVKLEYEYTTIETLFNSDNGFDHQESDFKTKYFDIELMEVEFCFDDIETNGITIEQIEIENNTLTIY